MTKPSHMSASFWSLLLVILAGASAGVVGIAHPSSTRQYTWPWIVCWHVAWLGTIAALGLALIRRTTWTWPGRLVLTGLLLLGGATVLSALASPYQSLSLPRIWPTLGGITFYLWLHDWLAEESETGRLKRITDGMAVFGGGLAVVSLAGWIWRAGGFSWSVRNDFPFGHSIQLAGAMLLVLPWLVAASHRHRGGARLGWMAATAAALLALLATSSRSAVLIACLVGAAGIIWAVIRAPWPTRIKLFSAATAAVCLLLVVLANPRLRELFTQGAWGETARESNTQRSAMIEAGLLMGSSRPLTGWGPGLVPVVYPQLRNQLHGGVDNVLQLHNSPVQIWATLGGPGLLALGILVVAGLRRFGQLTRHSLPAPATLASAASLTAYGLFALTDHQLDLPAINLLLVLNGVLFMRDALVRQAHRLTPAFRLAFAVVGGVGLLVPLGASVRDLAARYRYEQSLILFEHQRFSEGVDYLEKAIHLARFDPYYRHQLAARLLGKRDGSPDAASRTMLEQEAVEQLELSLATGCHEEFAHFNLGWLALDQGDFIRSASHFRATLNLAPHRRGAYLGLGLALRAAGREQEAVRAFALEWVNDPAAFTAPLWEWPDFAPLRPLVMAEADRLLSGLESVHPAVPYVRELWQWWAQGGTPPPTGYNRETSVFIRALQALQTNQPWPDEISVYSWGRLLQAAWAPDSRSRLKAMLPHNQDLAIALNLRADRHQPTDVHGFFCSGLENDPALLATERPARSGYGVLALHPDGMVLTDLYVRQQNRLVSEFASTVFPPKGWLPAADLLAATPKP